MSAAARKRLVPLLVGLMGGLLLLSASHPLVATLVTVIVSFALATLIHIRGERQDQPQHRLGSRRSDGICCLLVSLMFLALSPLVVLIAWARRILEAHSPLQAVTGAALAMVVTVTTFWLFGLR